MKTLLIDDQRQIVADRVARTYEDAIIALIHEGPWDLVLLDHDLGCFDEGGREKTGYDVLCFLESNLGLLPGQIIVVSSNPVGRERMKVVIDRLYNK